ncbi:competence/damage-inducible protein A [Limoniibacter endophyticus]|nr:competence/damage-inducible protein A [Limoniibacter endophyticus]
MSEIVTAAFIVIGDEILSGRTKDKNIGHIADILTSVGVDLKEVRIVSDDEDAIIDAVNALRARYTYVFTSGGIGPTHDDITADSISKAFDLPCEHDVAAIELLRDYYKGRDIEFNEARQRMARMPKGATHIANPISIAPGFRIGNVHVMAGVPSIFRAMLDNVLPTLETGAKLISTTTPCPFGEGIISTPLGQIQKDNPEAIIGSYPKLAESGNFMTDIVVRARSEEVLERTTGAVRALVARLLTEQDTGQ